MLVHTRRLRRRLGIAALALAAVGFPATAFGADAGGPRVVRIDPSGAQTVLAAGAPLNELTGIAVGPTGSVYVSSRGGVSGGVYSLTAPGFAISPLANTRPTVSPWDVLASGSTLYSLDRGGLVSIDTTAPFAQKLLSATSGSRHRGIQFHRALGPDPLRDVSQRLHGRIRSPTTSKAGWSPSTP